MLRNAQTVAQPTTEKSETAAKSAPEESASGFGTIQQTSESFKAKPTITPGFVATATAGVADQASSQPTSPESVAADAAKVDAPKVDAYKDDSIDFDALATCKVPALQAKPVVDEPSTAADPWSEDDAHLLDEILVEADAETAKANANKAANAAKSAATKAAANAALAAALAGNPDAAKTLDPKMLAAALNLSGGGSRTAPRAVAGKAPPPPTTLAPKPTPTPKAESPPSLTVVKTGTSQSN
jgi:hypothetical protein